MRGLLLSGLAASVFLLLGRISGFFREAFIAKNFGASEEADIIIILLTTPDLMINLLVGGAFSIVLIPAFNGLNKWEARELYREFSFLILMIFTFLSLLLMYFVNDLFGLLAPGVGGLSLVAKEAFQLSFLAIPLCALSGVTVSYLHYRGRFIVAAAGTLIFNLVLIIGLAIIYRNLLWNIAVILIVASMVRWYFQIVDSKSVPFKFSFVMIERKLLVNYCYAILSGGMLFSVPVILRAVSTYEGAGGLAMLNYSMKLVDLPVGVFATIFSVVFLPKLSQSALIKSNLEFSVVLSRLLFLCLACTLMASVVLFYISELVVGWVYDWGGMEEEEIGRIVGYFSIFLCTIPFQVLNVVLISAFAAKKDTVSPLFVVGAGVLIFLLYCVLVMPKISGLIFSSVILFVSICISLFIILVIRHQVQLFLNKIYIKEFLTLAIITLVVSYILYMISLSVTGFIYSLLVVLISGIGLILLLFFSSELKAFIAQK